MKKCMNPVRKVRDIESESYQGVYSLLGLGLDSTLDFIAFSVLGFISFMIFFTDLRSVLASGFTDLHWILESYKITIKLLSEAPCTRGSGFSSKVPDPGIFYLNDILENRGFRSRNIYILRCWIRCSIKHSKTPVKYQSRNYAASFLAFTKLGVRNRAAEELLHSVQSSGASEKSPSF